MTHRPIFCGLRVTTQRERKATVMWVLFAFGSALFAGLTSVLAKCGIKSPPSALRWSSPERWWCWRRYKGLFCCYYKKQVLRTDSIRSTCFWCRWPESNRYAIAGGGFWVICSTRNTDELSPLWRSLTDTKKPCQYYCFWSWCVKSSASSAISALFDLDGNFGFWRDIGGMWPTNGAQQHTQ